MVKAVIFDFNGVIVNDENYQNQSWKILLKKYGFDLTQEEFKKEVIGRRDKDTFEYLFKKKLSNKEANLLSEEREKILKMIIKNNLTLTKGLFSVLRKLKDLKIPLSIATGSRREYVEFIINRFKIKKYFLHIVTAEDIVFGKPNPEIYLKLASMLNIDPKECLVFEDSQSGVQAAKKAGMKVVALKTNENEKEIQLADKIITDFSNISVLELLNL